MEELLEETLGDEDVGGGSGEFALPGGLQTDLSMMTSPARAPPQRLPLLNRKLSYHVKWAGDKGDRVLAAARWVDGEVTRKKDRRKKAENPI